MIGVVGLAVSGQLSQDSCPTPFGVAFALQYEDGATLSEHEAIPFGVKGTACPRRVVISRRERIHGVEAGNDHACHRRLAPSSEHHVRVSTSYDLSRLTYRMS